MGQAPTRGRAAERRATPAGAAVDGLVTDRPATAAPTRVAAPESERPETALPETALPETAPPETAIPETALPGEAPPAQPGDRPRWRRVASAVTTVLAALIVLFALVAPNQISRFTPGALLRIPVEGLLGAVVLLLLPPWPRRLLAALGGVGLGLLTIIKIIDIGFYEVMDRPFNPVLDWTLLGDARNFLARSGGRVLGIGAVIVAALILFGVPFLLARAVLRLTRVGVRHRTTATRTVAVLGVVAAVCALLGVQIDPRLPVPSRSAAGLAYSHLQQARSGLRDNLAFAAQASFDKMGGIPGKDLLTALRGKDVLLTFVESYGRSAIEDPGLGSQVDPVLDAGTTRLRAAGFDARSAFLTSPQFGGGSWLAHATFLSGLWVNSQPRYRKLVDTHRLTLPSAFHRAGWRTVTIVPGVPGDWRQAAFYDYDTVYNAPSLGYRGPAFTLGTMPDQYTLSAFQRLEYGKPGRAPLMAELELTSSHGPWTPIPQFADWNSLGDGSAYLNTIPHQQTTNLRTGYRETIAYSLESLISYVEKYGNDNLVLVFLGDHQPAALVTGPGASRDVPVTIVAHDPAVLDRISGWGWQPGLRPAPNAPVWQMSDFRNRFLTAFAK
jgi:hypothetical protein